MTFSKVIELFVWKLSWSLAFENVKLKQANSSASERIPQAARRSPNKAKMLNYLFIAPNMKSTSWAGGLILALYTRLYISSIEIPTSASSTKES